MYDVNIRASKAKAELTSVFDGDGADLALDVIAAIGAIAEDVAQKTGMGASDVWGAIAEAVPKAFEEEWRNERLG